MSWHPLCEEDNSPGLLIIGRARDRGIPRSKGHPSLVAEVPSMVNDKHFQVGFLPSFLPSQVSGKALGMGDSCQSY